MNKQHRVIEKHLRIDQYNQSNAVECLASATSLSRQQIKMAMGNGAVWLSKNNQTRRLRRAKKELPVGSELHLYYDQQIQSQTPLEPIMMADEIAYSIWYKPYGVYCQGSKWGDHCTINRCIERKDNRPAIIVHRLDRAATGLIIIAHKKSIAATFSKYFQQRQITKKYRAIVMGKFPDDTKKVTISCDIDSRSAVSHVQFIQYDQLQNYSEVEVNIETGRKHQIRKHLSEIGYPIVGDRLYGRKESNSQDLQLCCSFLSFNCPVDHCLKSFQLRTDLLLKL